MLEQCLHYFSVKLIKAEKHFFEMEVKAACASPRERVICVQDHYPDADIIYQPACTILHRYAPLKKKTNFQRTLQIMITK